MRVPPRVYLGLIIDYVLMSFSLLSKKVDTVLSQCLYLLNAQSVSLNDIPSFPGYLNWATFAIPRAQAHFRSLQSDYISGLKRFGGDFKKLQISRLSTRLCHLSLSKPTKTQGPLSPFQSRV